MDENKTHVCELTGDKSCPIQMALDAAIVDPTKKRQQVAQRTEKLREENCTLGQCESLRVRARNLLSPQRPLLAELLPEYWKNT